MAYRKDEGRYARMSAFWSLFALLAFGCLGGAGLATTLRGWFPALGSAWTDPQPLIGDVDLAKMITLAVLFAGAFAIHRILNRPKYADLMIATEEELKGVTWPTAGEAWSGTVSVILTVAVLVLYLALIDIVLSNVLPAFMGVRA